LEEEASRRRRDSAVRSRKSCSDEAFALKTKEPVATMMRGQAIEVRLSSGRSLLVEPGFDEVHLRQLLSVLEA